MMNYEYLFFYGAASLISALALYIFRDIVSDIRMLRDEIKTKVTEQEVRQILSDRLDPIQQNLSSIQEKVDKIIDVLIKQKNS